MKKNIVLALLLGCASASFATEPAAAVATENSQNVKIFGEEAVVIAQTINGFMQGAKNRGLLETFDRKKGKIVKLKLDRIVTDDSERVVFTTPETVAICGELTEVTDVKNNKGGLVEEGVADKYEVWFLIKRGNLVTCRVLETYIKSVNGKPMYNWTKGEDGSWSATLAPDAP